MVDLARDGMPHVQVERAIRHAHHVGDVSYHIYAVRSGIRIAECKYTECSLSCDSKDNRKEAPDPNANAEVNYTGQITFFEDSRINLETDLLQPVMRAAGMEFLFVPLKPMSYSREIAAEGALLHVEAYDESVLIQENSIGSILFFPRGMPYTAAVTQLLEVPGSLIFNVEPSPLSFPADREDWEESDYILTVANQLLREINYTNLTVDRSGVITSKKYVEPSVVNAGIHYDDGDFNVLIPGKTIELDGYKKPNWFKGVSFNPDMKTPLEYVYQIDDPSIAISIPRQNGIMRREILNFDSVPDLDTLRQRVVRHAMEVAQAYERVAFSTAIMPHHETNEIMTIRAPGITGLYVETGWSIGSFGQGGVMAHNVRLVSRI